MKTCKFESCDRTDIEGWDMCKAHYTRWRRGKRGEELSKPVVSGSGRYMMYRESGVPKAERSPTSNDLHWAAGFLEGDGHFGPDLVKAAQKTKEPLERLQSIFGGTVRSVERRTPRDGDFSGSQNYYVWQVTGGRARGVAMTLYSLVSTRRQRQIRPGAFQSSRDETPELSPGPHDDV